MLILFCSRALEREELFQWSEVLRGIFNVQIWVNSTSYFAIVSGLYSLGLFVPVLVALLSDRLKIRGVIMLCVIPIAIAGYAVIANVKQPETRFAMTCLMALGMYCVVPPVLAWNANNSAGHNKRATTSGLQLLLPLLEASLPLLFTLIRKGPTIIMGIQPSSGCSATHGFWPTFSGVPRSTTTRREANITSTPALE
ncbi:putative transporter C11D3.18C [Beauveria bassiana]|nr:putative transporter C11D3.18C [Beauveria bassiana]KAH8715182.1 putative transporter C11D3.18C [Beauveria bassiana]